MKHLLLGLLSLLATPLLAQGTKVKPQHVAAPLVVKQQTAAARSQAKAVELAKIVPTLQKVDNKTVTLSWNNPETIDGIFDDFESHPDFAINSAGSLGWQYIDADNELTYTWTAASFPNQGQRMAFMVFNPSKTSPSTGTYPDVMPYSGNKVLVDFTVDGQNNDFIISPALNFSSDFKLSFRAKSKTDEWGKERIKVGYSTTGTRPSDFTFVQKGDYEEVPAAWTLYQYTIPQEAKYVCINCVSKEAFMLLLDDIFIGTNNVRPRVNAANATSSPRLAGFNLYRDDVKVNSSLITEVTTTDVVPDYGTYSYVVKSVLTDGTEADASDAFSVEVADIRYLPFFDDFDDNTIDSTLWSRPVTKTGEVNKWKSDYYAYGLVDFAACYPYSSIGTYSQSLVTRELRTKDPQNTSLRYEVRLDNNPKYTNGKLATEISTDGGNTWQTIDELLNNEGTYNWRKHEFQLSSYLNGAEFFYIRFRAYGNDANKINYWFVDDVKVWNPQTHSVTIKAHNSGKAVEGCVLTLKADNGAEYSVTTGADGSVVLPNMEEGTYEVTGDKVGYNYYTNTWTLGNDGTSQFTAALTRPVLSISEKEVATTSAMEALTEKTVTIENKGDGELFYNLYPTPENGSGTSDHRWNITQAFDASGDMQSSVAFDGEYFYASSHFFLNKFYKYDRTGHFVEEFYIPGYYYAVNDLCYDGTYFYASDRKNRIFQFDLHNKRLVKEIEIAEQPSLAVTHIAYDPRLDEFWVGDYSTMARINREGKVTLAPYSLGDVSVFGTAFDNITPGGPYLWMSDLVTSGLNTIDKVTIKLYNLNNRQFVSDAQHSAIDIPGYKTGSVSTGENRLGGMELTTSLVNGQLSLVSILQQSPSRIFVYNIADIDPWVSATPLSGTLQPGEKQEVKLAFDARNVELNKENKTTLQFRSLPKLSDNNDISVSLTADKEATLPRPTGLTVEVQGTSEAVLTWNEGTSSNKATAYAIYRNNVKVGETQALTYTDTKLVRGTYSYAVQAVYEGGASVLSDTAMVSVVVGEPYFAPTRLAATISGNKNVSLTWNAPDALLKNKTYIRWDGGTSDDAVGLAEGGYFYAGVAFDADDLTPYRGMTMDSVSMFIKERVQAMSINIYKNGTRISTQRVQPDDIHYGEFTNVALNTPVTIERGCTYYVALLIMHDANLLPLGTHSGTVVDGKSNLMSEDGKTWFPASYVGFENANFNIAAHLTPAENHNEAAPTAYVVYRNGAKVGESTTTTFADEVSAAGTYKYAVASKYGENELSSESDSVSVERIALDAPVAPRTVKAGVVRNRQVNLHWDFPMAQPSPIPVDLTAQSGITPDGYPDYVGAFKGAYTGEMGIASDGKYIYTCKYSSTGVINRYNMDGSLVGSFTMKVPQNLTTGFRNLAYTDGKFYATANGSTVYVLDMDAEEITDEMTISEIGRHIAFVPSLDGGRGGFEVGDWQTSIYTSLKGAKLGTGPAVLKGASGSAYANGILYTLEQGYNKDKPYELCAYDQATGELLRHTTLSNYGLINPSESASAGGMSTITTTDGYKFIVAGLQSTSGTTYYVFDAGTVKGLSGYNVYRNGVKVNAEPVTTRSFSEEIAEPGNYTYTIQTVYIDGTVSEQSHTVNVTISEAAAGTAPTDIKAHMASYGYDVNLTIIDPTMANADQLETFEAQTAGQPYTQSGWTNKNNLFKVVGGSLIEGKQAISSGEDEQAELIIPVNGTYSESFALSFLARTAAVADAAGELQVLTSSTTDDAANFINLGKVSTTEQLKQCRFTLPAGTKYVAIRVNSATAAQYIDAIAISSAKVGSIYGYDVYRNGQLITSEPAEGPLFTDHNLLPGTYSYEVVAHYDNSAVSPKSEAVSVTVNYSNGHQQPGTLTVSPTDKGNRLTWSVPALGDVTELRWHNGICSNAAGLPSGGSYYAGVQWNSADLESYKSLSVSEMKFYIYQVPDVLYVQLYQGEDLVFEKYVSDLRQYSFNTVRLDKPIKVDATKSMRAVLYVEHNQITTPIGYDEGPALGGKGNLYSTDGITWSTLSDNEIEGNWNISVCLQPYADNSKAAPTKSIGKHVENFNAHTAAAATSETLQPVTLSEPQPASFFSGYNIYCNGERINADMLSNDATEYVDSVTHPGRYYEYQVKAVYPDYGEVGSNVVRVMVSGINEVNADGNESNAPIYNLHGIRTNKHERGPVIQGGKKRIQ